MDKFIMTPFIWCLNLTFQSFFLHNVGLHFTHLFLLRYPQIMMPSGGRGGGYVPYISNSYAIRQEIQRFESVHPSIYAIYDLIDLVHDPYLVQQIREHLVCIEGKNSWIRYKITTRYNFVETLKKIR